MFTGIIEGLGKVETITSTGTNKTFTLSCPFTHELKIDQSLCHNGVCLTVVKIEGDRYDVTAIKETLDRTNLGKLKEGDFVNLERCLKANGRFDGHVVQGHVDETGVCKEVKDLNGSYEFLFEYVSSSGNITVEKGSICINGVSLTVVRSEKYFFSVHIIPYTFEHTTFKHIKAGTIVNLEFDVIGKYVQRIMRDRI
jgi:riboflavin synthase